MLRSEVAGKPIERDCVRNFVVIIIFRRYFAMETSEGHGDSDSAASNQSKSIQDAAQKLIGEKPATTASPVREKDPGSNADSADSDPSIQTLVSSARKLMAERQFSLASTMLEKELETHKDSKDIWLLYLQLKSQVSSPAELAELFHTAVSSCQSYAVIWEVRTLHALTRQLAAVGTRV